MNFVRIGIYAVFAGAFSVLALKPNGAAAMRAVDLGTFQYAYAVHPWVEATDINNHGQVVGLCSDPWTQWHEAILWQPYAPNSSSGQLLNQRALFNAAPRSSGQINDVGQVLGSRGLFTPATPNGLNGTVQPWSGVLPNVNGFSAVDSGDTLYLIDPGGQQTPVAQFADGNVVPWHINSHQQVAGFSWGGSRTRPFLYTPGSGASELPISFGRPVQIQMFLNDTGQIVVSAIPWTLGTTVTSSYVFQPDAPNSATGTAISLDEILGSPVVQVMDFNNRGQMIAWLMEDDGSNATEWLLTPEPGGYARIRIDDLPAMQIDASTIVRDFDMNGLNDHDQLVGSAQWSLDNGLTWTQHATMLLVPEPTPLLLMLLTATSLLARRRFLS